MTFPDLPLPTDADDGTVEFYGEGVALPAWVGQSSGTLADWLSAVAKTRDARISSLTYVLCDDAYLHRLNVEHLGHDTLTDVITFDLAEGTRRGIVGECYISLPRVEENGARYANSAVAPESTPAPAVTPETPPARPAPPALPSAEGSSEVSRGGARDERAGEAVGPTRDLAVEAELLRVMAHGLLHLCGLGDGTPAQTAEMRAAEDSALYIWRARRDALDA